MFFQTQFDSKFKFLVKSVSDTYAQQSLRPECALCVNVQALALAAALANGQLASDRHRMADLCFARSKFAEHFGDRAGLNAAAEQFVQLPRAGRQHHNLGALLVEVGGRVEAHRHQLAGLLDELVHLCIRETFDGSMAANSVNSRAINLASFSRMGISSSFFFSINYSQ